jgi:hypothetical protein
MLGRMIHDITARPQVCGPPHLPILTSNRLSGPFPAARPESRPLIVPRTGLLGLYLAFEKPLFEKLMAASRNLRPLPGNIAKGRRAICMSKE